MTHRTRRLLFFVSLLLFLAVSGPLLLYTIGYRFSFLNLSVRQTGGIFLHTNPTGSYFSVDDVEQNTSYLTGNAFIQNIQPAEYKVHVSHQGYQPWEKTITVEPHIVTELFPVLMPSTPVVTALKTASSTHMNGSPQTSLLILYHKEKSKHLYEIFDPKLRHTVPFADALSSSLMTSVPPDAVWHWNAPETEALIETPDDWLKLTRTNNTIRVRSLYRSTALMHVLPRKPLSVAQDPRNPDWYFLLDGTNFVRWDAAVQSAQQLLQSIGGFAAEADHLLLWDLQSGTTYRTTLDATQAESYYATTSLPTLVKSHLQEINSLLVLSSATDLWFIEQSGTQHHLVINAAEPYHIVYTNTYVLWWDTKTISIYWTVEDIGLPTFQKIRQELIYQSNTAIQNVMSYPEEQYLLMQENNSLFTLELDGRGGTRNKHMLYEGKNLFSRAPSQEKTVYVYDNGTLSMIKLP